MTTRRELLVHLWNEVINAYMQDDVLTNMTQNADRNPSGPFGDSGKAIRRILESGASPGDLALAFRSVAYEAVFETLYSLGDPGVDDDDVFMLHEELLNTDPSGMDGRPGSAVID